MNERQEPKVLRSIVAQGRCTGPSDVTFGRSDEGTEQMGLVFDVLKGEYEGRRLPWYGTVDSDKALALVKETLETAGWVGEGESSLSELKGLGSTLVQLAIDVIEIAGRDGTLRSVPKLRFVNRVAQARMKNPIVGDEREMLARDLEARMAKLAPRNGAKTKTRSAASPEEEAALGRDVDF